MAKFCTKCGSPLEDGKPCKCEGVEVKETTTSKFNIGDLLKEYLEVVKKTFSKPVDTLKEYASDDNFNLSLIAIAVLGLVTGLFTCLIMKNMLGIYSGLIEIPYLKLFIVSFISGVAGIALMALVAYVISDKFFKCETTIKKMMVLFGLSSTILSVALLVASLCTLVELNMTIVYLIVAAGALLNLCYNVKGIEHYTKLNTNVIGYTMILTTGISSTILYFVIKEVLPKVLA